MKRTVIAPMRAAVIARRLDLPADVREFARDVGARTASYGDEHAAAETIAGAAVYHAALLANEKRTQSEIAGVARVSDQSIGRVARSIRNEELELNETVELYRCTECGKLSVSLGWLHGHAEKHRGWGPWNLLPAIPGDAEALMGLTEIIEAEVTDVSPGGGGE